MIPPMASKFPHQPQLKKPTHFFKIISGHSLHEGKLMIPRAFVEKHGEALPQTMFLKPPNGKEWKLNLVKSDGNMWFQKGWKEFAEHHSLAHGHLLVFRYQRTSIFHVQIFDMSALEINYNFNRVEGTRASNCQGNKPLKGENLEDCRAGQKRKANLAFEFLQPCKMEIGSDVKVGNSVKFQKVALNHTGKKCKGKQIITMKQATVLARANSFKPANPFFLLCMQPSYIEYRCNLNIPSKFGKRHLDFGKDRGDIQLWVLNGRFWPARYSIRKRGENQRFELLIGSWKAFSQDNKLKVGDVCIFELIHETKLTFMVHIFRESDSSNCSTSQECSNKASSCQGQGKEKEMKTITSTKSSPP